MGFWPGGDRDGNPFVTTGITLKVAASLRNAIIKCYYLDVRKLKRRLTFKGVEELVASLEEKLYNHLFEQDCAETITIDEILKTFHQARNIIISQHNGLFVHLIDNFISKVEMFGLHFASLDIRQDSSVHTNLLTEIALKNTVLPSSYIKATEEEKINMLIKNKYSN